jgi:hypothetical protein
MYEQYDDAFQYGVDNSNTGFRDSSSSGRNESNMPQHTRHARRLYFGGYSTYI